MGFKILENAMKWKLAAAAAALEGIQMCLTTLYCITIFLIQFITSEFYLLNFCFFYLFYFLLFYSLQFFHIFIISFLFFCFLYSLKWCVLNIFIFVFVYILQITYFAIVKISSLSNNFIDECYLSLPSIFLCLSVSLYVPFLFLLSLCFF